MTPLLQLGSTFRDLADERGIDPFHAGALIVATAVATVVSAAFPATQPPVTVAAASEAAASSPCVVPHRARPCATSFATLGARR